MGRFYFFYYSFDWFIKIRFVASFAYIGFYMYTRWLFCFWLHDRNRVNNTVGQEVCCVSQLYNTSSAHDAYVIDERCTSCFKFFEERFSM